MSMGASTTGECRQSSVVSHQEKALTILIVDDHQLICDIMVDIVAPLLPPGSIVLSAATLKAAKKIVAIAGDLPDLIILDYGLPDADLTRHLECLTGSWKELPIFYISAIEDEELANKLGWAGALGFFSKRRPAKELQEILVVVIDAIKRERSRFRSNRICSPT